MNYYWEIITEKKTKNCYLMLLLECLLPIKYIMEMVWNNKSINGETRKKNFLPLKFILIIKLALYYVFFIANSRIQSWTILITNVNNSHIYFFITLNLLFLILVCTLKRNVNNDTSWYET